jgi:hypothetical protein
MKFMIVAKAAIANPRLGRNTIVSKRMFMNQEISPRKNPISTKKIP